ncbi:MAG: hypothetical protein KF810_15275 [Rhizobiaceae bacterium]|nr:hypothetical protein [Rhizobiaceae bacterium]
MANYYTHFSCLLDVRATENVEQALDVYRTLSRELESEGVSIGFVASVDSERSATTLWIRDEDHGDPEHVITFVRRCAEVFNLDGLWGFQWADTCSRPRLDGFGGGAHVVDLATGQSFDWNETSTWLAIVLDGGDPYA